MSAKPQRGLGRGFDALIPDNFDASLLADQNERVQKLPLDKLVAGPSQPRQHFDETAIAELAASIKQHGILQPLVVTPDGDKYRIIAGERRWRAAKLAKLTGVPAIVRSLKEHEQLEIALVENVQRVDLSPLEQAASIQRLRQQFNMTHEDIAKRLGKAPSTVSNLARLLQMPEPAQHALREQRINEGHARAILALKDWPEHQAELLQHIIAKGWSVRQAERFALSIKQGIRDTQETAARVATETPETKQLSRQWGAKVQVRRTAHGGNVEIRFTDDEELQRILELLKKIRS